MPTPTYDLISEQVLGSSAASVTFSSITGTYKDLVIEVTGAASATSDLQFTFNNDTGSNYSNTYMQGNGTSATSGRDPIPSVGRITTDVSTTTISVFSYSSTSVFKTSIGRSGSAGSAVFARVMLWRSTAAITQVDIKTFTGTWNTGTTFRLWGIA